jgi:NAD(P)-dependent dehydrogenase (short-subunit alcohol dehydrogenase family)
MRLKDRVAIITGAAGGIGGAIARRFAPEGARLCLADRYGCVGLAEELAASGVELIDIPMDVTDRFENRRMVERTVETFGRVDVLVTAAGIASTGNAETLSEAKWDRVVAVNLKGVFLSCQAVIPAMRAARYGRIVTIGSILAKNGGNPRPWIDRTEQDRSGNIAYGAAKAGVHAMTLYLAKELAADNITVNCVAPGPVASAMTTNLPETFKALLPVGRLGRPEEVADAVAYLAGEQASFTTGEILDVNGGGWVD